MARLVEPLGMAVVMPAPGQSTACLQRLAAAYGPAIAQLGARQRVHTAQLDVHWSGPQAFLACMPGDLDIEAELGRICEGTASVVDQSDGRFMLRLHGPDVRKTLAKGVSLDLHPRSFAPNETALTLLSHLTVQLTRVDEMSDGVQKGQTFEIVGPRAAAGDIWAWLKSSAAEFGLEYMDGR
jgi:sarcosine oxidase subunit gamma